MSIDKRKYVRYNTNTCTEHLFANTIEYGFDFVEGEMMKEKKRAENSRMSQETGRRKKYVKGRIDGIFMKGEKTDKKTGERKRVIHGEAASWFLSSFCSLVWGFALC